MDRKAWIIVSLCVVGIVLNTWYGATHQPPPKPEPVVTQDVAKDAAAPEPALPANPSAALAAPGQAAPGDLPEENVQIQKGEGANAVTFFLSSLGGGVAKAEMHKADGSIDVTLNQYGNASVTALSVGPDTVTNHPYRVVEKSATKVVFEGVEADGLKIRKEFTVDGVNDPHALNLKLTVTNGGAAKQSRSDLYLYSGAAAELRPSEIVKPSFVWNDGGSAAQQSVNSFSDQPTMFGLRSPVTEFHKPLEQARWGGVMSRFYTTLISTPDDQKAEVWARRFLVRHSSDEIKADAAAKNDYAIQGGFSLPQLDLEPGASKEFNYQLYMGPKIYGTLAALTPNRQQEFVMFYGFFSWFSRLFVFVLHHFHDWTGNWGVAIIMLTFCIRMFLWPLQARSNATMKRMSLLQPKMKELQEKYKDDPTRMNTEVMKLYREYSVNPVSGCLPLLIQLPIFMGFYSMLQYAAELRGQPFIFWIKDLSLPDTVGHVPGLGWAINILPIIMGITMILQFKLTPQPQATDKTQQKIFMFMPFIFLYVSYSYASALALYWAFQNIISITQAQIQRRYGKQPELGAPVKPDSRVSSGGSQKKKDKPSQPRLGGGGTKSRK